MAYEDDTDSNDSRLSTTDVFIAPNPAGITAKINYLSSKKKPSYFFNQSPAPGQPMSTYESESHEITIRDARAMPDGELTLDQSGFEFVTDATSQRYQGSWFSYDLFKSNRRIHTEYYPQVKRLLKSKLPGVKEIAIFDHVLRRHSPGAPGTVELRQPFHDVHVDLTPYTAEQRLEQHFYRREKERPLKRYQIINVWRPLFDDVEDCPLALADYRTIDHAPCDTNNKQEEGDMVVFDLLFSDCRGETFRVRHNEKHAWYYLPHQMSHEVTLIKCYDSKNHSDKNHKVAGFAPHTAFHNPEAPSTARRRESIEVRALVLY